MRETMRQFYKILAGAAFLMMFPAIVQAGNPDRTGQAGASELLINPWARAMGWNGVNIAGARGIEAMSINVGGLVFVEKTSISFSQVNYLGGSGTDINTLGFAQKVGEGAIGFTVTSYG